jgi:hypothetical protein
MIVSVTEADAKSQEANPDLRIVQFGLFVDNRSYDKRGRLTSRAGAEKGYSLVGLLMPKAAAEQFEADVQKNPGIANELLEKSLVGMDETTEHPGIRRYKANSLIYLPKSKLAATIGDGGVDPRTNDKQLKDFINGCIRLPLE